MKMLGFGMIAVAILLIYFAVTPFQQAGYLAPQFVQAGSPEQILPPANVSIMGSSHTGTRLQ